MRWSADEVSMMTIDDIMQELEQEAPGTRRVLERIPEDQLDWRPHPKSMTMGELAMHVANIPGAIVEVSQRPFDVRTPIPRPGAGSLAQILAVFDESLGRARVLLGAMNDADLAAPWSMMDGDKELWSIPRGAFLRSVLLNHWYHHRGQLTVYLRQTGALVPAVFGDSADEKMMAAV
jgi:uncharacterized damage-inducible protein DinB